jgi:MFS family permease
MKRKVSADFAWIITGSSFITLALSYGVWYSFSVFFVALLKEFAWSRSLLAGAFSTFVIVHGITGPVAGSIVDRFGPRRVFIAGSFLIGIGLALCSWISSPWQFYIFFGIIAATGVSFTGWVPNTTVIQYWFRERRGLAMGIISSGVGVGILVCVPLVQYLISRGGWRATYRLMALFVPIMIALMSIVLSKKPPLTTPSRSPEDKIAPPDPPVVEGEWTSRAWTIRQAVTTKQFYLMGTSFFLGSLSNQAILAHHVAFFVDQGLGALFASYVVGLLGAISMGGKILWGALSDRIGREVTYTMGSSASVIGLALLISFTMVPFPYTPYFYALFFGMGYAVTASLPPLITADFFEGKTYGSIFGTIQLLNGMGAATGAWLAGFVYDLVGSYVPVFLMMIAAVLYGCFTVWKAGPRKIRVVPGKRGKVHSPMAAFPGTYKKQ